MALVSIPLLGQASGKLSEIEFYRSHGVNIIRSSKLKRYKPASKINSVYQEGLSRLVGNSKSIYGLISATLTKPRRKISWLNTYVNYNYDVVVFEGSILFIIDRLYRMRFSFNNVDVCRSVDSFVYDAHAVTCTFSYNPNIDIYSFNIFFVLVQYNFRDTIYHIANIYSFEPLTANFDYFEPPFGGQDYALFAVFCDTNTNYLAQTIFCGLVQHG